MSRPRSLQFARDESPPLPVLVLSGLQHNAVLVGVGVVLPLLVLGRGDLDEATTRTCLGLALIALGLSTILQIQRGPLLGSGYLAPSTFAAAYLPACISAMEKGGPGLVMGMLVFGGVVQMAMAPLLRRLRPYLPPEIGGLAVLMIGIFLGLLSFRLLTEQGPVGAGGIWLGVLALAVTIAVSLWGTGRLRLYGTLLGLGAGCAVALATGALDGAMLFRGVVEQGVQLPWPAFPTPRFDPLLAPEFAISAVACGLRAMGDLITCQKLEDTQWTRPDTESIRRGILAEGLGTALGGLIGNPIGLNTFSGSIGLAAATGVTARRVGYAVAGWVFAIALLPGVLSFFIAIPRPIMGGVLLFAAAFIIFNGIQVIVGRMLDARRILVLGIALILGISRDVFPAVYVDMPAAVLALTSSPLMVAVGTALVLNLIFRLGVARTAVLTLPAGSLTPSTLESWVHEQGSRWGARADVMRTVTQGLNEFVEARDDLMVADAEVRIDLAFDEFHVDLDLAYAGRPMITATAGPVAPGDRLDDLDPDTVGARVRTLLLRHLADRITARQDRDGRQVISLRFEH